MRSPGKAPALTAIGAELIAGDLDDADALDTLCAGADGLFHVAGWYKVGARHPEEGHRTNVEGTRASLAAARRAGIRVVHTSTLAINSDTHGQVVDEDYRFEGEHISTYDLTKAAAHEIARDAAAEGLDVVIVQPGLVYGPGDTSQTGAMVAAVIAGGRPLLSDGGGACWGFVDDIAHGHVLAMQHGRAGRSYMLAGPRATLAEGLRLAAQVAGTKGPIVLPAAPVRVGARVVRGVERVIPIHGDYASESMRASLATYWGDPTRAETELGWTARSLHDGMSQTVAALQG